jgi:hypothetical protein
MLYQVDTNETAVAKCDTRVKRSSHHEYCTHECDTRMNIVPKMQAILDVCI